MSGFFVRGSLHRQADMKRMKQTYQGMSAGPMAPRRAFQEKLEAQLAVWNADLAYMQYQAITAPDGPKPKHAIVIELLRRRQDAARTRLEELKRRGDSWEDLKPVLERQWESLGNDFDHSLRWFRQEVSARGSCADSHQDSAQ